MRPAGHGSRDRSLRDPPADEPPGTVHPRLTAAFTRLDEARVRWCLLRGRDGLSDPSGDVDLLIHPADQRRGGAALTAAGFVVRRRWASGSQTMHLTYDEATGGWIHLHVVSDLSFGPDHRFRVPGVREVLSRVEPVARVPMPDPTDRFWLLLFHSLLDKDALAERHRDQLRALTEAGVTDRDVARRIALPPAFEPVRAVRGGRWDELARGRKELQAFLAQRDPRAALRGIRNRAELTSRKVIEAVSDPGMVIALLAPDGAGKSTLAGALARSLPWEARTVHLGLYSATESQPTTPGIGLAVRLGRAWRRGLAVRWHRARRRTVILDRHPLGAAATAHRTRRALVRNRLLASVVPRPDLTLILDVPAETLHRRRPEHDLDELERARAGYLELAGRMDGAAVLDATGPPDEVLRAAGAEIWRTYQRTRQ